MRKIVLAVMMLAAMSYVAQAQLTTGVVTRRNGEVTAFDPNNVEYKSIVMTQPALSEIVSMLPTEIELVEGEEGHIEISYPAAEEEWLDCRVWNGIQLVVGVKEQSALQANGNSRTIGNTSQLPKTSIISAQVPIRVRVSTSKLRSIVATADVELYVERDKFHSWLEIISCSTLAIIADSITADSKIEIVNQGTTTCNVENWNTDNLLFTNVGFLFMKGRTSAKSIAHTSSGIDNIELEVACAKLDVTSTGSGVVCYRGSADEVNITSMGKASIRTSELNK